ncbi:MAG: efflux RND transporter periplasmic adaptor subunit, partial [Pseudomonas sp.]
MFRHALSLAVPVTLISLLVACGNGDSVETPARPAMVVQPLPASDAMDTYPGEVRARFEPELAFRIGGKISKRLVDAGARVKKDQALAELDAEDVKLQLEAARAQVTAAEANLKLVRAERDRYQTLLQRQMISRSQFDNVENQAGYSVLRAS